MATEQIDFSIPSMSCDRCEKRITETLTAVPGVSGAETNLPKKQVAVRYDAAVVTVAKLATALRKAGFEAMYA
jgi:copper chaperone CopZ